MLATAMEIQNRVEEGLRHFTGLVLGDPHLRAEFEASVVEFFGGPLPEGGARETYAAARRHIEWFLLERHSPALFKVPVEALVHAWRKQVQEDVRELEKAFLDSFTGVFRVTSVTEDGGIWLRDLAGFGEHPVSDAPVTAGHLEEDDLVVGRLFPIPESGCHLSRAAAVFRDENLFAAVKRDLERVRTERGSGRVLHISQRELEVMFWHSPRHTDVREHEEPIEAARRFLADGGLASAEIDALFSRLNREPFDGKKFAHGAGDALGEILDTFAFETDIDLTRAREILTLAWAALAEPQPRPSASRALGERAELGAAQGPRGAVEAFEAGRQAGQDLEGLFQALERDLGLEGESEDDEQQTPAPDFPGVISAMVEEFLWEIREVRSDPDLCARYEILRALGRFGAGIGVFESLSAKDLLHFTAFWLAERGEVRDAETAHRLLEALDAFCEWAESVHEVSLKTEFGATLEALRSSLPRIVEANARLAPNARTPSSSGAGQAADGSSAREPADDRVDRESSSGDEDVADLGELYELVAPAAGDRWRLRDRGGREHHAAPPGDLIPMLRPGDRLRGRIELDGTAVVFRVYPPEAAGLLG